MKKEMLINVAQPEECRIAIVEGGLLEELYIERASQDNYVGNIYKGKVVNLEPSIQAAFVDFGVGRNGFLHISDVEPQYFRQGGYDPDHLDDSEEEGGFRGRDRGRNRRDAPPRRDREAGRDREIIRDREAVVDRDAGRDAGRDLETVRDAEGGPGLDRYPDDEPEGDRDEGRERGGRRDEPGGQRSGRPAQRGRGRDRMGSRPRFKPPIQEIFKRGDEVLVQVIKEGIGAKGPTLSTYISIPGRYLVLMPALGRVGVSRKIDDDEDRRRLRDALLDLNPPKGLGFIVRTAGQGRTRRDLSRDLAYLLRLWKVIVRRVQKKAAPVDIYEESDMIIRTIRDIFSGDVDSIYIDEVGAYERAKEFLELVMPKYVDRLHFYDGKEPLFHRYKLEQEIANIHRREVKLPDGGSIVIDSTEALVAIDVNSGNFRTDDSAEETAYQLNMAAAREIARQLRLRDLGGVIVNDFIDMRKERHRRNVERALRNAMSRDRARTKILRTSPFGLIEMTRQRIRPSLKRSVFTDCPCCSSRGIVKTEESMSIEVIRWLMLASQNPDVDRVSIKVNDKVAGYLNNKKRRELSSLEEEGKISVQIHGTENSFPEYLEIECKDKKGNEVPLPV